MENFSALYNSFTDTFKRAFPSLSSTDQLDRAHAEWNLLQEENLPNTEAFVEAVRARIIELNAPGRSAFNPVERAMALFEVLTPSSHD